jgi:WD40 repeat protein
MARRKAGENQVKVGNVTDISGEVNIAAGDIIKNIKTIHQRALTAAEEATHARKLENRLLAQGIATLVQNLSAQASEGTESDSPYKGLLPYSLNEAEIFYGRNKAKKDLLVHIKQSPLTVLHAESGAGKSSLLQAGIAAQLIANGHLAVYLRPYHADPVDFIKRMFLPELTQAPALADAPLREFLRQVCAVLGPKIHLYLLLDQFEEFFQLKKDERQPFLESLAECLSDPSLNVRWVLALRKEALSDLAELESFGITQFKNTYRLDRLSRAEAQEAMVEPARRYGITFEPALTEHILDTLTTNDEIRPTHLQLVCYALTNDLPEEKTLTLAYYTEQEGGTEGILRDYLKRQLEDLPASEQILAWKVLRVLITADRHRAVKTYDEIVQELKTSGTSKKQIETVLGRLVERRLLFTQTQPATEEVFELAHDYLIKEIELDPQEQALKAAQELLDQETRTYQRHKTLLSAERLAVIEPYRNELRLSAGAEVLLRESRKAVLEDRRLRQRRRQMTVGVLIAVAIAVFWGFRSSEEAKQQAKISRAGRLAAQSVFLREKFLQSSLLLGIEAFRLLDTVETRGALRDATIANPQLVQFLRGYPERVVSIVFRPDGRMLASSYTDGTIILWDAETRQPIGEPIRGHTESVYGLAFSSDSKMLASISVDNTVILWDAASRQQLGQLPTGQAGRVSSIAFSPDGRMLASSGDKLILWDTASRQQISQLATGQTGQAGWVSSIAFSPNGKILASAGGERGSDDDKVIILWDVASRQPIGQPLIVGEDWISSLVFSPDSKILASAGGKIILWDITSPQPTELPLIGQKSGVSSIAFSPNGKTLASAGGEGGSDGDKVIILWDVASRQQTDQPLAGHTSSVLSVVFSPDGRFLASSGFDNQIILWDVASRQQIIGQPLIGHTSSVNGVAFSPDGQILASGNQDKTIRLWDVETRQPIGQPLRHTDAVYSVAFSPDGKILASGSADNTIILWDVETRQPIGQPLRHTDVYSVAFSPDGKTLASGSSDGTIILWDVASRQPIGQPLTGHTGWITSVAFSPDSKILASGSGDGDNTIILWDVTSRQPTSPRLIGHTDLIVSYSAAFSPDGQTLASAGGHEFILWDVTSRQPIGQTITSQTGFIENVAFSPDGKTLATGGDELILWDLDPSSWIEQACQRAGGNFTLAEWERYFPDEKYRRICDQWPPAPEATPEPSAVP